VTALIVLFVVVPAGAAAIGAGSAVVAEYFSRRRARR
jgi:hypothetical protein